MLQKLKDGRTDLVYDLLQNGYKATDTDENDIEIIKWCAYYGDVSSVRFLVKEGASLSMLGKNYDLNGAVFHGHWQLCQYLLEHGAKADEVDQNTGESLLHTSLCAPNRPVSNIIVKLLLHYGADPLVKAKNRKETGGFMRDAYTRGESALHRAAAFGNEETIQLLLDAGADKSALDAQGDSPMSWASWHQRPGKILALLTYNDHRVHPLHVKNMQSDHGSGWGAGISVMRMGELHLE